LEIDLGDVSRLDYYTGLTFKIYVNGAGARIGSGGRYDGLTASFGKREPAVGFVVDLDALTDVLRERGRMTSGARDTQGPPSQLKDTDPSKLFIRAIDRRARGERVSLSLR
jgi:ATP phosphoribosyltransferase regulatory subunit